MISVRQVRHGLGTLSRNRYDFNEAVKRNTVLIRCHRDRRRFSLNCFFFVLLGRWTTIKLLVSL